MGQGLGFCSWFKVPDCGDTKVPCSLDSLDKRGLDSLSEGAAEGDPTCDLREKAHWGFRV